MHLRVKPRTGMLTAYLNNDDYDLAGSFVIGDRATDVELARNLGCRAIFLQDSGISSGEKDLRGLRLATTNWDRMAEFLFAGERKAEVRRTTKGNGYSGLLESRRARELQHHYRTGFL